MLFVCVSVCVICPALLCLLSSSILFPTYCHSYDRTVGVVAGNSLSQSFGCTPSLVSGSLHVS